MADITRNAAVELTNKMLKKYKKAINVCQKNKDLLTAEATEIVNDYEDKRIDEIISALLVDEGYFGNYGNDELYFLLDISRKMLMKVGLLIEKDVKNVNGVKDAGNLTILSDVYESTGTRNICTGTSVVYNIMNGEKKLDSLISRARYAVEWQFEKLETPSMKLEGETEKKQSPLYELENDWILFNQFDRSFKFSDPGKYKVSANIYEKDIWGRRELVDIVSYEQVVEYDKFDGEVPYEIESSTEGEYFSFKSGIFHIDTRGTEINIFDLFEDVFPETSRKTDVIFYRKICRDCLETPDPDHISGEYTVDLRVDGDDENCENNNFGSIMRKKYLSERFEKKGYKGVAEGRTILKHFDDIHGTKICKSETDSYSKSEDLYYQLVPSGELKKELFEFLNSIDIRNLFDENYINDNLLMAVLKLSLDVQGYALRWIELFKHLSLSDIDKCSLEDYEKMAFVRILVEIKEGLEHLKNQFFLLIFAIKIIGLIVVTCVKPALKFALDRLFKFLGVPISVDELKLIIEDIIEKYGQKAVNFLDDKFENFGPPYDENGGKLRHSFAFKAQKDTKGNVDYFYTTQGSLQAKMGFMDAYDECSALLGMKGLQDIIVVFPYEDKEYRVEFWYGPYGFGAAIGAEIGIYTRPLSNALEKQYIQKKENETEEEKKKRIANNKYILYDSVQDTDEKISEFEREGQAYTPEEVKNDQFVMSLNIKYDENEVATHSTVSHTGKEGDDDHFWCLTIKADLEGQFKDSSKIFKDKKKLNLRKMEVTGTIEKLEPKLISIMFAALRTANIPGKKLEVTKIGLTKLNIVYGEG